MSSRVGFPRDLQKYSKYFKRVSLYHETVLPIMLILRFIGVYTYKREADGSVTMEYKSFTFVYSFTMYVCQVMISVKAISIYYHYYSTIKTYSSVQLYVVIFMSSIPFFTAPLAWIRGKSLESFFRNWTSMQEKYNQITHTPLSKGHIKWRIFLYTVIFATIYSSFFILVDLIQLERFHIAFCVLCVLQHSLFMSLCVMTMRTFRIIMNHYRDQLKQVLSAKIIGIRLVEEYRLLWVSISQLVQQFGACFSFMLTLHLLIHSIMLVLLVYNFVGFASHYLKLKEYYNFSKSFVAPWIPLAMIYVCCNIGHLMTKHCTDNMSELIVEAKLKHLVLQTDGTVPIKLFLYALNDFKPSVNILGYFEINRPLFGSIVSVLVTYMIVLVQFGSN